MIYTTNLEISKKLKSLGVKQDSLFTWFENEANKIVRLAFKTQIGYYDENGAGFSNQFVDTVRTYSAYTLSELPSVLQQVGVKMGWGLLTCEDCKKVSYDCECGGGAHMQIRTYKYHFMNICELIATRTELMCGTCGVELNKCRLKGHDQVGITAADEYLEGVLR